MLGSPFPISCDLNPRRRQLSPLAPPCRRAPETPRPPCCARWGRSAGCAGRRPSGTLWSGAAPRPALWAGEMGGRAVRGAAHCGGCRVRWAGLPCCAPYLVGSCSRKVRKAQALPLSDTAEETEKHMRCLPWAQAAPRPGAGGAAPRPAGARYNPARLALLWRLQHYSLVHGGNACCLW